MGQSKKKNKNKQEEKYKREEKKRQVVTELSNKPVSSTTALLIQKFPSDNKNSPTNRIIAEILSELENFKMQVACVKWDGIHLEKILKITSKGFSNWLDKNQAMISSEKTCLEHIQKFAGEAVQSYEGFYQGYSMKSFDENNQSLFNVALVTNFNLELLITELKKQYKKPVTKELYELIMKMNARMIILCSFTENVKLFQQYVDRMDFPFQEQRGDFTALISMLRITKVINFDDDNLFKLINACKLVYETQKEKSNYSFLAGMMMLIGYMYKTRSKEFIRQNHKLQSQNFHKLAFKCYQEAVAWYLKKTDYQGVEFYYLVLDIQFMANELFSMLAKQIEEMSKSIAKHYNQLKALLTNYVGLIKTMISILKTQGMLYRIVDGGKNNVVNVENWMVALECRINEMRKILFLRNTTIAKKVTVSQKVPAVAKTSILPAEIIKRIEDINTDWERWLSELKLVVKEMDVDKCDIQTIMDYANTVCEKPDLVCAVYNITAVLAEKQYPDLYIESLYEQAVIYAQIGRKHANAVDLVQCFQEKKKDINQELAATDLVNEYFEKSIQLCETMRKLCKQEDFIVLIDRENAREKLDFIRLAVNDLLASITLCILRLKSDHEFYISQKAAIKDSLIRTGQWEKREPTFKDEAKLLAECDKNNEKIKVLLAKTNLGNTSDDLFVIEEKSQEDSKSEEPQRNRRHSV